MTGHHQALNFISSMIDDYLSGGLVPDKETAGFINSAYGLSEPGEIASMIECGGDGGAVADMLSYPPDAFRETIEQHIPPEGLSEKDIKSIEDSFYLQPAGIFILYKRIKIHLSAEDSLFCRKRFIRRLNLDIAFNFLSEIKTSDSNHIFHAIRAMLRKKKFRSGDENCRFINDLISRYYPIQKFFSSPEIQCKTGGNNSVPYPGNPLSDSGSGNCSELKDLVDFSAGLLNGSESRPFDILSERKYYYENAVIEIEEFNRLMKTYSMEFIMMKKIQPPLISIDEARYMLRTIDRLTLIVYGMIIPSVRNIVVDEG